MSIDIFFKTYKSNNYTLTVPDIAEPLWVEDTHQLRMGDGVTPGGVPILGSVDTSSCCFISVYTNTNYTASVRDLVHADTSDGSFIVTAPTQNLKIGDRFAVVDISVNFDSTSNNVLVDFTPEKVYKTEYCKFLCDSAGLFVIFTYDPLYGWKIDLGGSVAKRHSGITGLVKHGDIRGIDTIPFSYNGNEYTYMLFQDGYLIGFQ